MNSGCIFYVAMKFISSASYFAIKAYSLIEYPFRDEKALPGSCERYLSAHHKLCFVCFLKNNKMKTKKTFDYMDCSKKEGS